jgi:hypothetical protein
MRLPSSMSGFPALRCFIFFATDLFILPLPSFGRVRIPVYIPLWVRLNGAICL